MQPQCDTQPGQGTVHHNIFYKLAKVLTPKVGGAQEKQKQNQRQWIHLKSQVDKLLVKKACTTTTLQYSFSIESENSFFPAEKTDTNCEEQEMKPFS